MAPGREDYEEMKRDTGSRRAKSNEDVDEREKRDGGLDLFLPALARLLIPPLPTEPLISHLRIVDKYIINPPTTYVDKALIKLFHERSDLIEYRQGNLTNPNVVSNAFTDPAPNGAPYAYIVDVTGEIVPNRTVETYIANTLNTALLIARTSAAQLSLNPGSIKAHIRLMPPFYAHTDPKRRYKETDPEGWKPKDLRAVWWHETIRAVGSVEGLPLVVLRSAFIYGDGFCKFETLSLILLGLVYKHLGQEMKLLWSPDLPKSSINTFDMVGVIWKAAEWMSTKSRSEANELAGAPLPPSGDQSVIDSNSPDVIPASAGSVVVPAFNVVDESNSTQASISAVIGRVFGIKVGFENFFTGLVAGMNIAEVTEELNQYHMGAWYEIITTAKPPVPSTPLSPMLHQAIVAEHGCSMDGERLKTILQYQYRYPQFSEQAVRDYIEWCRGEGIWPETNLYTAP